MAQEEWLEQQRLAASQRPEGVMSCAHAHMRTHTHTLLLSHTHTQTHTHNAHTLLYASSLSHTHISTCLYTDCIISVFHSRLSYKWFQF